MHVILEQEAAPENIDINALIDELHKRGSMYDCLEVFMMKLAVVGEDKLQKDFLELLIRSDSKDMNYETLNKIFDELDRIGWAVSFSDFDYLHTMKEFLLEDKYFYSLHYKLVNNIETVEKLILSPFLDTKSMTNVVDTLCKLDGLKHECYEKLLQTMYDRKQFNQYAITDFPEDIILRLLNEGDKIKNTNLLYALIKRKSYSRELSQRILEASSECFKGYNDPYHVTVIVNLLERGDLPEDIVIELLEDGDKENRNIYASCVAENPNASEALLLKAIDTGSRYKFEIDSRIARRADITDKIAEKLMNLNIIAIDYDLLQNENVSISIRRKLFGYLYENAPHLRIQLEPLRKQLA